MPESDVDLLISANVRGLKFYGLVEEIRVALRKKVDVLDINQLKDNIELTEEILNIRVVYYIFHLQLSFVINLIFRRMIFQVDDTRKSTPLYMLSTAPEPSYPSRNFPWN